MINGAERSVFSAGQARAHNCTNGNGVQLFADNGGMVITGKAEGHSVGKMVERFFSPAIALMNRMSYTRKFMVLWLVSLAAITVVVYSLFISLNRIIVTSQQQLDGIELIEPALLAMQIIQQHRGLSAAFLGSNDTVLDRIITNEREAEKAFDAITVESPPDIALVHLAHDYQQIRADWALLRKEWTKFTVDDSYAAHSRLIERIRLFGMNVADEYALTTKSEIDTFYLIDTIVNKLPDALEHFGQIRGYGTGILAKRQITEQQKMKLNSLVVELRSALYELNINLGKISSHNPVLRESVSNMVDTIIVPTRQITSLVESDILTGRLAIASGDFYDMATAAINKSYTQMYVSLLPMARTLISTRLARAENTLYASVGTAFLLLLVVIYFSIGIYYAIINNIKSLARSASAFARGDLRERVNLSTHDEISWVADSFNEMADGFAALLESHQASEEIIWQQANFDSLTGLPNRRMFHDRLEQDLKKAHRDKLKIALLFIDLDKFKEINDTLGHNIGDILLKEAAHRITGCVRDTDTVARLGGDEFTVILMGPGDISSIERVTECILMKLADPFQLGIRMVYISGCIGITIYPDDATEIADLLKNADQAMYASKNRGRGRYSYFTPTLQRIAQAKLQLHGDLRNALATGQFTIHYQPIVELTTGRIHKAEALIRWQHPQRGMVNPAEFIPIAEETGLIVEIGDWIFIEVAKQIKYWRDMFDPSLQISLNKSPVQFRQPRKAHDSWLGHLQKLDIPGQSIVVEITEGLLLDAEDGVSGKLAEFREAGVQMAIDDFGTGYSSLSYLKKFDIDYLKIDRSFISNLALGSSDLALSEAIVVMAHKLGMKVIAEGVETETQYRFLSTMGCDYAQGYLFSRPMPAGEFEALLGKNYESLPAASWR